MASEQPSPTQLFSLKDVRSLLMLSAGSVVATAVPSRWDGMAAEGLLRAYRALRAKETSEIAALMARTLPSDPSRDWQALAEAHARMRLEDFWGRLRDIGPLRWRPTIELEGAELVQQALQRGRGAVLWMMRLASATVIKQAFHRAGMPLVHLSRAGHGAESNTRLAVSAVSPLLCRAENPYLKERIKIPPSGSLAYVSALRDRLQRNACVSIFGEHAGRQNVEAPFLGGRRRFAIGAPSLAWLEDSALLTVYAVRTGPFAYSVVINEPIPVDAKASRKAFAAQAVREYARGLERLIERHPADWQGWSYWDALNISPPG